MSSRTQAWQGLADAWTQYVFEPDLAALKVVCSVFSSHYLCPLELPPTWLLVIAPSGSGKTMLIEAFSRIPSYCALSSLTPNTLFSAYKPKAGDNLPAGLLPRLGNSVILALKDFTSILSLRSEAKAEIMTQLREAHDQSYVRGHGLGGTIPWQGRLTIVAGCTPAIESDRMAFRSMGDRFMEVWPRTPNPLEVAKRITKPTKDLRERVRSLVADYLNPNGLVCPELPNNIRDKIAAFATATATLRTPIRYDPKGYHILDIEDTELPTRTSQCLHSIALSSAALDGAPTVRQEDLTLTARVALDSIPRRRLAVIRACQAPIDLEACRVATKLSPWVFGRTVKELEALRLLENTTEGSKETIRALLTLPS